jgi:protoheme IX farnesyltransferase
MPVVATFRRTAVEIMVYTVIMVGLSLALAPVAHLGLLYVVSAAVLGIGFIAMAARMWVRATPKASMQLFSYSITYLTLLFVIMAVDVFVQH